MSNPTVSPNWRHLTEVDEDASAESMYMESKWFRCYAYAVGGDLLDCCWYVESRRGTIGYGSSRNCGECPTIESAQLAAEARLKEIANDIILMLASGPPIP